MPENDYSQVRSIDMAGVLDTVNQRTQLVGENRLELLLFRVNGSSGIRN